MRKEAEFDNTSVHAYTDEPVKRDPEVQAEVKYLRNAVEGLSEDVSRLLGRLVIVSRESEPTEESNAVPQVVPVCELGSEIRSSREVVNRLARRIQEAIERLEV